MSKIAQYAKLIAAILTVLVTAGVGLIPVNWIGWVQLAIAVLGAVSVWAVPNAITDAQAKAIGTTTGIPTAPAGE